MYTLLVLCVMSVLVFGASAASVAKRDEQIVMERCMEVADCMHPIGNFLESRNIPASSYLTAAEYPEFCEHNITVQVCFATKKDSCPWSGDMQGLLLQLAYLCSDDGRAAHQTVVNSPCITNRADGHVAYNGTMDCAQGFNPGPEDLNRCLAVNNFKSCIVTALTRQCGGVFATFGQKLWALSYKTKFTELGCSLQD